MRFSRIFKRGLVAAALAGAAFLLYKTFSRYSVEDVFRSLEAIPAVRIGVAFIFVGLSYLCLTAFDWLGVRYAGKPLPWRRAALASFVSLSIGHNVGMAALSSGAIRYRFYSRWGLNAGDVARIILFAGMTVGLGLATLGGIALLISLPAPQRLPGLGQGAHGALAMLCLAIPAVYLVLAWKIRRPLAFRKWSLHLPRPKMAVMQVAVGAANFACVAACLHQLLAAFSEEPYLRVASAYVVGNVAGLISHVPGGLGVLEATVLHFIAGAPAIGAVIAFRVLYFFLPLAVGLPLFIVSEFAIRSPDVAGRKGS